MHRSLSIVALTAVGALVMACADTSTSPRFARHAEVLSGGKSVTIDALVVQNGQIVQHTSAGEVQAFALQNGTQTLLGAESAQTFTSMSVTVPTGASLVLKVLPFASTTLINWFQGPEAAGPELSSANPFTVPFASLISNYTADCALEPSGGGGGGGGGGIH